MSDCDSIVSRCYSTALWLHAVAYEFVIVTRQQGSECDYLGLAIKTVASKRASQSERAAYF